MLLGVALIVPALSAQDKDKKESKESHDKLIKVPDPIYGKVTHVDAMDKSISLQIGKNNEKLMTVDDLKVRSQEPPVAYDDKGNKKKYTAKEKKELRGPDPKLPGYTAGFEDLKVNQIVEVWLVYKKSDKTKPLASMILIVRQGS
jgi:hypothetical protein